jgi:hypothetical protein
MIGHTASFDRLPAFRMTSLIVSDRLRSRAVNARGLRRAVRHDLHAKCRPEFLRFSDATVAMRPLDELRFWNPYFFSRFLGTNAE